VLCGGGQQLGRRYEAVEKLFQCSLSGDFTKENFVVGAVYGGVFLVSIGQAHKVVVGEAVGVADTHKVQVGARDYLPDFVWSS
jgi:hypothetical protein